MNWAIGDLEEAIGHTRWNADEVRGSRICVCLGCRDYFSASKVDWRKPIGDQVAANVPVSQQADAICPKCGADGVIGDKSDLPIQNSNFIEALRGRWTDSLYAQNR